jgi:phosphoglycerol transferase MdoB-like AlkP superfamily enzyme
MLKLFFRYTIIWCLIFFSFRVSFLVYYSNQIANESFFNHFLVIINGLRFDLSVNFLLLFPFLLLSRILILNRFIYYVYFWKYFPLAIIIYSIYHLIGDFFYFQNANKHLGYEGFVFFGKDFFVVLNSLLEGNSTVIIILFISSIFFGILLFKMIQKIKIDNEEVDKKFFFKTILIVLISILFIRGGFQKSFLSPSNAIVTQNPLMNQFVLNGIFTTILDFRIEKFPNFQKLDIIQSTAIVRETISYNGAEFINPNYPIYRKTTTINKGKPDIVLIILESWPTKYTHDIYEPKINNQLITPNLKNLMRKGTYFPRFIANGGRTSNGLISLLTGIPDRPGISLIHTKYSLNSVTGLGNILKNSGYKTNFFYGGELAFENITPVIKHWGFDNLVDLPVFQKMNKYKKGIWGFNDDDVLQETFEFLSYPEASPRLTVLLTVSTHHPFQIPDKQFEIVSPLDEENQFINSLYYADWSLGNFFSKVEKSEKFNNTIFIIVSDHTSHRKLDYFQDRNIPFLILGKGIPKNNINTNIASQIDVLPTILSLVDGEHYFSSLGKNILGENKNGYAYISFGNIFGWAEDPFFFIDTVDKHNALLFTTSEPFLGKGDCNQLKVLCESHHLKSKAFLNLTEFLHKNNKISP